MPLTSHYVEMILVEHCRRRGANVSETILGVFFGLLHMRMGILVAAAVVVLTNIAAAAGAVAGVVPVVVAVAPRWLLGLITGGDDVDVLGLVAHAGTLAELLEQFVLGLAQTSLQAAETRLGLLVLVVLHRGQWQRQLLRVRCHVAFLLALEGSSRRRIVDVGGGGHGTS